MINSGFPLDADRLARQAIDEADRAGLPPPPEPYYALPSWFARMMGSLQEAVDLARVGAARATEPDQQWMALVIRTQGASALLLIDRDAAAAEFDELREIADRLGVPVLGAAVAWGRLAAAADEGDLEGCERLLDRAEELATGTALHVRINCRLFRGLLVVETEPERAQALLGEALDLGDRYAVMPEMMAMGYDAVAALWLAEGRAEDAAILVAAADGLRDSIGAAALQRDWLGGVLDRSLLSSPLVVDPRERDELTALGRAMSRDEIRRRALGEYDPRSG